MAYTPPRLFDLDTSGNTDYSPAVGLLIPTALGPQLVGTEDAPLKVALPAGQTVPISNVNITAINSAIGAASDAPATSTGTFNLIALIKGIFSFLSAIYNWLTPKQQILQVQAFTFPDPAATTTIGAGTSSITIYRTNDTGTVSVQGVDSALPPVSLGIKNGVFGTVLNPRDTFTGLSVTAAGGATLVAVTVIQKP